MSSQSDSDSSRAFAAHIRKTLLNGFAIPLGLLVFFTLTPAWLNHKLHSALTESTLRRYLPADEQTRQLESLRRVDFATVCGNTPAGFENLHAELEQSGACRQFHRLQWARGFSWLLVAILASVAGATLVLNRRAQRSRSDLIVAYRQAWRLTIAAALAKLILIVPLVAYGISELIILITDQFLLRIVVIIAAVGFFTLVRSAFILLNPAPMEFEIPLSRAITPLETPELWAEVRDAAARLGTAPPDHIFVGMEHNFYVTEFPVIHQGGKATGRILYLSLPLLQQLAPAEVMAIIGHELGHFRGGDLRITREFYPLRFKARATLEALDRAGWLGWTSVQALKFFLCSFAGTERAMWRERELAADRASVELNSPEVAASALVKTHVFDRAFIATLCSDVADPFGVPLAGLVRTKVGGNEKFWQQLLEQSAPHPLDFHPPLRLRLEALGQPVDPFSAMTVATTETATAYARWFAGQDALFAPIHAEAMQRVSEVRASIADYKTPEGKALIDRHFPEILWPASQAIMWMNIFVCGLALGFFLFLFFTISNRDVRLLMTGLAVICGWCIFVQWRRHHDGVFVLRPDSLSYTGWRHPLRFADIADMDVSSDSNGLKVTFRLKVKAPCIWTYNPLWWLQHRAVKLNLRLIAGNSEDNWETLGSYITHQDLTQ